MKPIFIFDLDGTLADAQHRMHLIEGETKDWAAFFAACPDDTPIDHTLRTLKYLRNAGAEIWIWTGRSDEVALATHEWLRSYGLINDNMKMRMRPAGDHRPDTVLKGEWLESLADGDRARLLAVFEDRSSVVDMWRAAGVPCYQVAPGDY